MARLQELILGHRRHRNKSGYGLTLEGELKMLRVIQRIKQAVPIPVKATFLGAHAFPEIYKQDHEGHISLITKRNAAQYCQRGTGRFYRCVL